METIKNHIRRDVNMEGEGREWVGAVGAFLYAKGNLIGIEMGLVGSLMSCSLRTCSYVSIVPPQFVRWS